MLQARRAALVDIANETKTVLPRIVAEIRSLQADACTALALDDLPLLTEEECPRYNREPGAAEQPGGQASDLKDTSSGRARRSVRAACIRVVNQDCVDAAIALNQLPRRRCENPHRDGLTTTRAAVLNMASAARPGGGWLSGARAQEEDICRRTSLHLSLHQRHYPHGPTSAYYSPDVVVIRTSGADDHQLLSEAPSSLPVISVISCAAIDGPATTVDSRHGCVFARAADAALTKDKMRLVLRIAAMYGHTRLVLGALSCGAFRNPPSQIAHFWLEVLLEDEFGGGWWEEVTFAVLDAGSASGDGGGASNFDVFTSTLHGRMV